MPIENEETKNNSEEENQPKKKETEEENLEDELQKVPEEENEASSEPASVENSSKSENAEEKVEKKVDPFHWRDVLGSGRLYTKIMVEGGDEKVANGDLVQLEISIPVIAHHLRFGSSVDSDCELEFLENQTGRVANLLSWATSSSAFSKELSAQLSFS